MNASGRRPSEDFAPVVVARQVHALSRPSLSYWQDAGRRLRKNTSASASLGVVIALALFAIAGPWVWRVDPAVQDVGQISQPPSRPVTALIDEPATPWAGVTAEPTQAGLVVTNLRIAQPATTQSVQLVWDPVADAAG